MTLILISWVQGNFKNTRLSKQCIIWICPNLSMELPGLCQKPALTTFGAVIRSAFTMWGLCHLPVIVNRKFICSKNNDNQHTTITYRDIKSLNKEQFISSLHEVPWDCAFVFEDPNDVVDAWYKIFNGINWWAPTFETKESKAQSSAKMVQR